jgi:5-methylcytosine-specific restriction endonuclease McrA
MTIYRLCPRCGTKISQADGHRPGPCDDCRRTYDRERARTKRQRLARNSTLGKRMREIVKQRDGHACRRCGATTKLEVHHIVSLQAGGAAYDPHNMITLCRVCHNKETIG